MKKFLIILALLIIPAQVLAIGIRSPVVHDSTSRALTSGFFDAEEVNTGLVNTLLEDAGYTYRVSNPLISDWTQVADDFVSYPYFLTGTGLFSTASGTYCEVALDFEGWICDIGAAGPAPEPEYDEFGVPLETELDKCAGVDLFEDWSCEYDGVVKHINDKFYVLIESEVTHDENPATLPFCPVRCYDARGDMQKTGWLSTMAPADHFTAIKKGFRGYINMRPYANGCWVDGTIKLCVNGPNLDFSFTYPDGITETISAPIQMKYWNSIGFSLSPNFMALFVRQHGTNNDDFEIKDMIYRPIDNDELGYSYPIDIHFGIRDGSTRDPYEFFAINFVDATDVGAPFCSEELAACRYNDVGTHAFEENDRVYFGGFSASTNGTIPKKGFSYYLRDGVKEADVNTGALLWPTDEDPGRGGAYHYWYAGNSSYYSKFGITQRVIENDKPEYYAFYLNPRTMTWESRNYWRSLRSSYWTPFSLWRYYDSRYYSRIPRNYDWTHFRANWTPHAYMWRDTGAAADMCNEGNPWFTSGNNAQIYYVQNNSASGSYLKSTPNYIADGEWHEMVVDLSTGSNWFNRSTFTGFRFDVLTAKGLLIDIKRVAIEDAAGNVAWAKDFAASQPWATNNIAQYHGDDLSYMTFRSTNNDPMIHMYGLGNFNTNTYTKLRIVYRMEPSGSQEMYAENGCWKATDPMCPEGQFDWWAQGTCYSFEGRAQCHEEGLIEVGDTRERRDSRCAKPTGTVPDICPNDGRDWTQLGKTTDFTCRVYSEHVPYCAPGEVRRGNSCISITNSDCNGQYFWPLNHHCYYTTTKVCPSGTVEENGQCVVKTRTYTDKNTEVPPAGSGDFWGFEDPTTGETYNWSCNSNGTTIAGDTKYSKAHCNTSLDFKYMTYETVVDPNNSEFMCTDTLSNKTDCGCPNNGNSPTPSACIKSKVCPAGYTADSRIPGGCRKYYKYSCPSGYSYVGDGKCERTVRYACAYSSPSPRDYTNYNGTTDRCYANKAGVCPSGYTSYRNPATGYLECYIPNDHPTAGSVPYCPEGQVLDNNWWNKRCLLKHDKICGGDPTGKKYPGGYSNSRYRDYKGTCYQKQHNVCASTSQWPMRSLHGDDITCWVYEDGVTGIDRATDDIVSNMMCSYIADNNIGASAGCITGTPFPKDVVSTYNKPKDLYQECPIDKNSHCVPVAGDLSMCGTAKPCIGCSNKDTLETSTGLSAIDQAMESEGKAYGISRDTYNYENTLINAPALDARPVEKGFESDKIVSLFGLSKSQFWEKLGEGETLPDLDEKRFMAVVWDNPIDAGFLAKCEIDKNGDGLCTADKKECVAGVCPYGAEYPCQPMDDGKKYCSEFSHYCENLANPENAVSDEPDTEGDNDSADDADINDAGDCEGTFYIFNGNDKRCRKAGIETGGADCCKKTRNWFGLGHCSENEKILSSLRMEAPGGTCTEVGEYCSRKILGVCIQRKKTYCCYNSVLARMVQEQGRPQLQRFGASGGWGSPTAPNCQGMTPEEFSNLDFSKMDLSEYYDSVGGEFGESMQQNVGDKATNFMNSIQ